MKGKTRRQARVIEDSLEEKDSLEETEIEASEPKSAVAGGIFFLVP